MFSLKNIGSIALQSTKSKLITFSQTNHALNCTIEPSLVAGALLQAQNIFDTQVRYRRSCIADLKKDYNWKRERPFGPHRHQPPNVRGHRAAENYHHIIHYPEEYTIKKLDVTKLGGRHPVTGRKVIQGVGGGSKQKARWIDWLRVPRDWPQDGSVLEERVIQVSYDPMRKAMIAMTGYQDKLRWQIATDKMKEGDIIRTFTTIPKNPIRPIEGDSHPLGALPTGTTVCLVEKWPGEGAWFAKNAEESAKIMRRVGDRIVIKCWDKLEFSIPQEAMCVVGTVSIHPLKALPISSPNRMRWLGIAPRSGLWHRKDGYRGRKIKKPPPTIETTNHEEYMKGAGIDNAWPGYKQKTIICENFSEGKRGRRAAGKRSVIKDGIINW